MASHNLLGIWARGFFESLALSTRPKTPDSAITAFEQFARAWWKGDKEAGDEGKDAGDGGRDGGKTEAS